MSSVELSIPMLQYLITIEVRYAPYNIGVRTPILVVRLEIGVESLFWAVTSHKTTGKIWRCRNDDAYGSTHNAPTRKSSEIVLPAYESKRAV